MSTTRNLLVELFVEELPPKALRKIGDAFASTLAASLKAQGLAGEQSAVTPYASPRRLAVHVSAVLEVGLDAEVTRKLMPVAVGLGKDGRPTDALRKNLAKLGRAHLADLWPNSVDGPDKMFVQPDGKTEALFLRSLAKGTTLHVGLQNALDEALEKLPIPKVMQYQLADGWTSVNFVRPAHGLVALHGPDVVPVSALGLDAGRETHGHRFEAQFEDIELQHADHYARQLDEQGAVIASFEARHGEIVRQLQHAAAAEGLTPIDDAALLDEVTALVERPNVLLCRFEEQFLEVPAECLILTMKANQKYFPLLAADGRLTNKFLIVSNIRPEDPSRVVQGNERVVRPRLADAKFFFDQDRKKTLASRVPGLDKVVYHAKLGTMGERMTRVRTIAREIGRLLDGDVLAQRADQAAMLAKADLLTDMVGEFPELQGIMGGYYARHDGLADQVAFAIEDHYKPRFAGDTLPRQAAGLAVALADKLETLAGLFGIGQVPTGDKDPFALRRHALGIIRMLIERELALPVGTLLDFAFGVFPQAQPQAREALEVFLRERLVGYLREAGHAGQDVEAVVEARPARWAEIPKRLDAVRAFKALPEAEPLAAANKRVGNILKKSEQGAGAAVQVALLKEPAERSLHEALVRVAPGADAAFAAGDYTGSLQALAALKAPVDAFFDGVMVNADDPALRANRLGLLAQLHAAMNRVADLSRLAA
jgi:glycyl-tRNA synthetase beta chain